MKRISLHFAGETHEFNPVEGVVPLVWEGPAGLSDAESIAAISQALEQPLGYPALRRTVVPGDRVAIACDLSGPEVRLALTKVIEILRECEVGSITIVGPAEAQNPEVDGVEFIHHHAEKREELAYLASTKSERRVYLNRALVDADSVVVVSRLGFDERGRPVGPGTCLYPGFGDLDALKADRLSQAEPSDEDSTEAAWLLGEPFLVGVLPGRGGIRAVFAGVGRELAEGSRAALEDLWTLRVDDRADLVLACVGSPDRPTSWRDLGRALTVCQSLVRRGGRAVLLSQINESPGPAVSRLLNARDFRAGESALKGKESEPDWPAAHALVSAAQWADLFLLSGLEAGLVDSLGICPIENVAQAIRLTREAHTMIVVNDADRTHAEVKGEVRAPGAGSHREKAKK